MPKARPRGLSSPITPRILKAMSRANVAAYKATGGRIGGTWRVGSALRKGVPICLLTTTGRKSGRERVAPLLYLADGERIIVVASQGGMPNHPAWYLNLTANPAVSIRVGKRTASYLARTASEDERAALWPRLVDLYADYDNYQSWTTRVIPVVICEPA